MGLLGNQEIRGCEHVLKSWIDKHGPINIFMMYDSDKLSQYLRQELSTKPHQAQQEFINVVGRITGALLLKLPQATSANGADEHHENFAQTLEALIEKTMEILCRLESVEQVTDIPEVCLRLFCLISLLVDSQKEDGQNGNIFEILQAMCVLNLADVVSDGNPVALQVISVLLERCLCPMPSHAKAFLSQSQQQELPNQLNLKFHS